MQNVVQRRTQQPQPPSGPQQHSNTLADQLRSRLEERRKSKEEEEQPQQPQVLQQPPQPLPQQQQQPLQHHQQQPLLQQQPQQPPQNAAFVPEAMAADIQKAVKMANETSKSMI